MIGALGSSFCPENTQIEFACAGPCVGLPFPVISPAKATLDVAPMNASAQVAPTIALRSMCLPSCSRHFEPASRTRQQDLPACDNARKGRGVRDRHRREV
jgi:hypothetical protein